MVSLGVGGGNANRQRRLFCLGHDTISPNAGVYGFVSEKAVFILVDTGSFLPFSLSCRADVASPTQLYIMMTLVVSKRACS